MTRRSLFKTLLAAVLAPASLLARRRKKVVLVEDASNVLWSDKRRQTPLAAAFRKFWEKAVERELERRSGPGDDEPYGINYWLRRP